MFCQYQYYRWDTKELQAAVKHSEDIYKCEEMTDCPYTGTTLITKIPWESHNPAIEEDRETDSEEESETAGRPDFPGCG